MLQHNATRALAGICVFNLAALFPRALAGICVFNLGALFQQSEHPDTTWIRSTRIVLPCLQYTCWMIQNLNVLVWHPWCRLKASLKLSMALVYLVLVLNCNFTLRCCRIVKGSCISGFQQYFMCEGQVTLLPSNCCIVTAYKLSLLLQLFFLVSKHIHI